MWSDDAHSLDAPGLDAPGLDGHRLGGHTADAAPTAWSSLLQRWLAGARPRAGEAMTMTEELFRDDGYLRECTATVTQVDAAGIRPRPHRVLSDGRRPARAIAAC
ncbi:MAG: hypothetical protein WDO24_01550 [Pseudomonadota bacterium]